MPNKNPGAVVDMVSFGENGAANIQGTVAQRLAANNFNVNSLRVFDILQKDEWIDFDEVVLEQARQRLIGVGDLIERGLTHNVNNAMGITKIEWDRAGDMTPAEVSMAGVTQGQNDRILFELQSVPLPIIHKDFHINVRALESSRNTGESLDTTQAALASRLVSERIESLLYLGSDINGTNNKIFGYTTEPNRNTGSVTASWASATGEQIVGDVLTMIGVAADDNMFGPFIIYVPVTVHTALGDDYKTNSDKTIIQRVKEIPGIIDVKPTSNLTGDNVVLVQMSSDVVDMVDGIQPTMVQWETQGGMLLHFKVLAIMVPRVKSDKAGQSGIVHFS